MTIKTDTIVEYTAAAGVTVDGVLIKDGTVDGADVSALATVSHAAVTLDTNADTLLSLSTQALGLDAQTANRTLSGPVSGSAAVPTFRALVSDDIPTLDHGTKLSGLSDNDHPQYVLAADGATGAFQSLAGEDITVVNGQITAIGSPARRFWPTAFWPTPSAT